MADTGKTIALIKALGGNGGGGSGGGVLFLAQNESGALNKTYNEIVAASESMIVVLKTSDGVYTKFTGLYDYGEEDGNFYVEFSSGSVMYMAESADGYPVLQ